MSDRTDYTPEPGDTDADRLVVALVEVDRLRSRLREIMQTARMMSRADACSDELWRRRVSVLDRLATEALEPGK